jgi:hypothetical protein
MRVVKLALTSAVAASATLLALACGDDEGGGNTHRTCGDGRCEPNDCESTVRCPNDCGTCIGMECDVSSAVGSCGKACTSSCECASKAELCTATYGDLPGRCVPIDCRHCDNFQSCEFTPDGDGVCSSVTCT